MGLYPPYRYPVAKGSTPRTTNLRNLHCFWNTTHEFNIGWKNNIEKKRQSQLYSGYQHSHNWDTPTTQDSQRENGMMLQNTHAQASDLQTSIQPNEESRGSNKEKVDKLKGRRMTDGHSLHSTRKQCRRLYLGNTVQVRRSPTRVWDNSKYATINTSLGM